MKVLVITEYSLDGLLNDLLIRWFYSDNFSDVHITTKQVSNFNLKQSVHQYIKAIDFDQYDKVFICNISIEDIIETIDNKKLVFISNTDTEIKNSYLCSIKCNTEVCCSSLHTLYLLKDKIKLTPEKIELIKIITSYYKQKIDPLSMNFNFLFWSITDSYSQFVRRYIDGYVSFSVSDKIVIDAYQTRLKKAVASSSSFSGTEIINGITFNIKISVASDCCWDVCKLNLVDINTDISITINPKDNFVYFITKNSNSVVFKYYRKALPDMLGGSRYYKSPLTTEFLKYCNLKYT